MITQMTNSFPWDELAVPKGHGEYVYQFISEESNPRKRPVYWARSWRNCPALLVEYDSATWTRMEPLTFKNISVGDSIQEGQGTGTLVIELMDRGEESSELFLKVCADIVETLQRHPADEARLACIYRLERWRAFFKTSRTKLTAEQQKGLMAELRFLQRVLFSALGSGEALLSWTGPDRDQRDFSSGQIFVEVKSKRSSSHHEIAISSEEQLNTNAAERLFLCVAEANTASAGTRNAFTVTDVVREVEAVLESPMQRELFESKLSAVGYFEEDDYSDSLWSEGVTCYYEVRDGFPRLRSSDLAAGVNSVSYHIDLDFCDEYRVSRSDVIEAMG